MSDLILFLVVAALGVALLSVLSVWSYGQFARQLRVEPSQALPVAGSSTPLDAVVEALSPPAGAGNGLLLLSDGLDAFVGRAISARSAGRSLDLLYYIWDDDLTGRLLTQEVVSAADRGVRVRLLLDDINASGADPVYLALDSHPNIELRLFNPTRARTPGLRRGLEMILRAFSATRRMHNKAWIADGRMAIVGGRNIGDEYFDADEEANFRDLDLVLLGPLVKQVEAVFDAFWNSASAIPIGALAKGRRADISAMREKLSVAVEAPATRQFFDRLRDHTSLRVFLQHGTIHWTAEARVVSDPPEKTLGNKRGNWLMSQLLPVLTSATRRIDITSPYFVPGNQGIQALRQWRQQGVTLRVLTNSLAATDVAVVHGGYAPARIPLLQAGIALYELRPDIFRRGFSLLGSSGASLHTKAFTVDGEKGFIGSFNFDPRSIALNTEMGVLFRSPALLSEMTALFEREIGPSFSYELCLDDGSLRWRTQEEGKIAVYKSEPNAGILRRAVAWFTGWLPIRSQL